MWRFFMREMLNNKLPRIGLKEMCILHIKSKLIKMKKKLYIDSTILLKQRKEPGEKFMVAKINLNIIRVVAFKNLM